jgi:ABC-type spermidine/putrescine transport system permease subunit II
MVGALSIVRFRTAVKDPMDLMFLFWSIAVGIICGAQLPTIAVVLSGVLTVGILALQATPLAKAPMILVVSAEDASLRSAILAAAKTGASAFQVKSQTMEPGHMDMILEVRTADPQALLDRVAEISGVVRCSLVSHDGEVTF